MAWLTYTAESAASAAAQAMASAAAFETAYAMTVPPADVAANRALLARLVATNTFGQNVPAIAAAEARYSEMWAQDASAMYGYAASSAAAGRLSPLTEPTSVSTPAGIANQAAAVAQAAASGSAVQEGLSSLISHGPDAVHEPRRAGGGGVQSDDGAGIPPLARQQRTSVLGEFRSQPGHLLGLQPLVR